MRLVSDQPDQDLPGVERAPLVECSKCSTHMTVVGIERDNPPDHYLYTFSCPSCGHTEALSVHTRTQ